MWSLFLVLVKSCSRVLYELQFLHRRFWETSKKWIAIIITVWINMFRQKWSYLGNISQTVCKAEWHMDYLHEAWSDESRFLILVPIVVLPFCPCSVKKSIADFLIYEGLTCGHWVNKILLLLFLLLLLLLLGLLALFRYIVERIWKKILYVPHAPKIMELRIYCNFVLYRCHHCINWN